ncbi:nitroreductase family deazaflavin-dependent oxidoreductase [Georgenia alba]|uniref:Nitroreductase family deazaflavin-dependent oxidoreductase n=1 Tax=Georgenia alba TaxID=2233858 RepID=A0ABW2Q2J2_9MICO
MGVKQRYLWLLKNTLNRATTRAARSGRGPFWLVRHVGRRSGRTYETPLILARVPEGFVAELTYGPEVSWYRNIVAAGRCEVIRGANVYPVVAVEDYPTAAGRAAFPRPAQVMLRLLRRHEFRLLRLAGSPHDRT